MSCWGLEWIWVLSCTGTLCSKSLVTSRWTARGTCADMRCWLDDLARLPPQLSETTMLMEAELWASLRVLH